MDDEKNTAAWPEGPPGYGKPTRILVDHAEDAIRRLLREVYGFESCRAYELACWPLHFYPINRSNSDSVKPQQHEATQDTQTPESKINEQTRFWCLVRVREPCKPTQSADSPKFRHSYAVVDLQAAAVAQKKFYDDNQTLIRTPLAPWFIELDETSDTVKWINQNTLDLSSRTSELGAVKSERDDLSKADDGGQPDDHDIESTPLARDLVEQYLRFFCWAIRAEKGAFYVLANLRDDIPWRNFTTVPDEADRSSSKNESFAEQRDIYTRLCSEHENDWKKVLNEIQNLKELTAEKEQKYSGQKCFTVHLSREEAQKIVQVNIQEKEKRFSEQYETSVRFSAFVVATVSYGTGVFNAVFGITEAGFVDMLEDWAIFDGVDVVSERADSLATFKLRSRFFYPIWRPGVHPPQWILDPSSAYTARTDSASVDAGMLPMSVDQLADLALQVTEQAQAGSQSEVDADDLGTLQVCTIKDRVFKESLTLPPTRISWRFINCKFEKGVHLKDQRIDGQLEFVYCEFLSVSTSTSICDGIAFNAANAEFKLGLSFFMCAFSGRFFAPAVQVYKSLSLRGCRIASDPEIARTLVGIDQIDEAAHRAYKDDLNNGFGNLAAFNIVGAKIGHDLEIAAAMPECSETARHEEALWHVNMSHHQKATNYQQQLSKIFCRSILKKNQSSLSDTEHPEDLTQSVIADFIDRLEIIHAQFGEEREQIGKSKPLDQKELKEREIKHTTSAKRVVEDCSTALAVEVSDFEQFLNMYPGNDQDPVVNFLYSDRAIRQQLNKRLSGNWVQGVCTSIQGRIDASEVQVSGVVVLFGLSVASVFWCAWASIGRLSTWHSSIKLTSGSIFRCDACYFDKTVFRSDVTLTLSRTVGVLSFKGCTIQCSLSLLGTVIGGDLTCNRLTINQSLDAIHTSNSKDILHRPSLRVEGDWKLSGANIGSVQTRGIEVNGAVIAKGAKFTDMMLGIGIKFKENSLVPGPRHIAAGSKCGALEFDALEIEGDLNLVGLEVSQPDNRVHKKAIEELFAQRLSIKNCKIGQSLLFYKKYVGRELMRVWSGSRKVDDELELPPPGEHGMKSESSVWGGVDLRANTIGGKLQLTGLKAQGPIELSKSSVTLGVFCEADPKQSYDYEIRRFAHELLELGLQKMRSALQEFLETPRNATCQDLLDAIKAVLHDIDSMTDTDGLFHMGECNATNFVLDQRVIQKVVNILMIYPDDLSNLPDLSKLSEFSELFDHDGAHFKDDPVHNQFRSAHDLTVNRIMDIQSGLDELSKAGNLFNKVRTECTRFDAEQLECNGDMILDGLCISGESAVTNSQDSKNQGMAIHEVADVVGLLARGCQVKGDVVLTTPKSERRRVLHSIQTGNADPVNLSPKNLELYHKDPVKHEAPTEAPTDEPPNQESSEPEPPRLYVLHKGSKEWFGQQLVKIEKTSEDDQQLFNGLQCSKTIDFTGLESGRLVIGGEWMNSHVELVRSNMGRFEVICLNANDSFSIDLHLAQIARWMIESGQPESRENFTRNGLAEENPSVEDFEEVLKKLKPIDRASWLEVERSLRNEGQVSKATQLYFCMMKAEREGLHGAWAHFKQRVYWSFAKLESNWELLLAVCILQLIVGTCMFSNPRTVSVSPGLVEALSAMGAPSIDEQSQASAYYRIQDTSPMALGFGDDSRASKITSWGFDDGLAMSIRHQIPFITLLTKTHWEPTDRVVPVGMLYLDSGHWNPMLKVVSPPFTPEHFALWQTVSGWIFSPFILVGLGRQAFRDRALAKS